MALNDPVEEPPAQPKRDLPAGPGRRAGLPCGHAGDKASGPARPRAGDGPFDNGDRKRPLPKTPSTSLSGVSRDHHELYYPGEYHHRTRRPVSYTHLTL